MEGARPVIAEAAEVLRADITDDLAGASRSPPIDEYGAARLCKMSGLEGAREFIPGRLVVGGDDYEGIIGVLPGGSGVTMQENRAKEEDRKQGREREEGFHGSRMGTTSEGSTVAWRGVPSRGRGFNS
jgi:hypothetical protein